MSCPNRSPEKRYRTGGTPGPGSSAVFCMANCAALFCSALSASSQVVCPTIGSDSISSNRAPNGPSLSFFPTTLAALTICGGR